MAHRVIVMLCLSLVLASTAACTDDGLDLPFLGDDATATPEATLQAVKAAGEVFAEGRVVPVQHAQLSFVVGGIASKVLVSEGDEVKAGDMLVRLDSSRQAAAVLQAEAVFDAALAYLRDLEAGASAEELAVAEAAVRSAEGSVQSAQGAAAGASAGLAKVQASATEEELAIAQHRVAQAKNALWGAQARRDTICGRVPKMADQADCDTARAAVHQAEEEVRIAEWERISILRGARPEDTSAARARVQQAYGEVRAAEARADQARADLDRLRAGASAHDLVAARAQLDQATAALEQAYLAMDEMRLLAPFAGTVAAVDVSAGELVSPGAAVVVLADQSEWLVETDDLTELNIIGIDPGDRATLTIDALPDLVLEGEVIAVKPLGENRLGDIVYTVSVRPERHEARLRWNMTAGVALQP